MTDSEPDVRQGGIASLDLRRSDDDGGVRFDPVRVVPLHSDHWAGVVRPFTFFIFGMLGVVIIIPFVLVSTLPTDKLDIAFDWAKTILAPVVGFASAAVGYYYGTRQSMTDDGRAGRDGRVDAR